MPNDASEGSRYDANAYGFADCSTRPYYIIIKK